MNIIRLQEVVPEVFEGHVPMSPQSDVWGHDLIFEKGKSYLVKAASGRGKSSLCSYIYGLRNDYSGRITFDGQELNNISEKEWNTIRQNALGVLFQDLRLFGELNAVENVMIKANLTACRNRDEVVSMLAELGLGDRLEQPVRLMSFGQQQRVAFVRMLCQRADFWLLDEPVSHLDDSNARVMAQMLYREAKRNGAGVIVTTVGHDLSCDYDKTLML